MDHERRSAPFAQSRQPDDPGAPPLSRARSWWGWPFVVTTAAVLGFAVGVFLT